MGSRLEQIRRLLTALFLLGAALVLAVIGYFFQDTVFAAVIFGALGFALWGILYGIKAMVDYWRFTNSQE